MPNFHIHDHDEPEFSPDRTLVQGTQRQAVETGHEGTDANIRAIIGWFTGLALTALVTLILVGGIMFAWEAYQRQTNRVDFPLLAHDQIPPEPRILPNPADPMLAPSDAPRGPWEAYEELHQQENARLEKVGLYNSQTGVMQIPAPAADAAMGYGTSSGAKEPDQEIEPGESPVNGERGAPNAGEKNRDLTLEPQPSAASGGLAWENGLR